MRNLLFAALMSLAAGSAVVAPAQAASIIINTDDGFRGPAVTYRDPGVNTYHRRHYNDDNYSNYGWNRQHRVHGMRYQPDCTTRLVRHWVNHRMVMRQVRVCD